ncbi:MAG: pantetheine-phosphate adenylyltransferase [Gammaproteobacteria bacterium]
MRITAIYPGSFDPITHGHADIVMRASGLFERVVVAVAASTTKQPVFTADERVAFARTVFDGVKNVTVCRFDGLLADAAREHRARVILRGLRAVSDFEYEFQMAGMNRKLVPESDTLFLTTAEQYGYISSSLVREVASLGGDVSEFVHPVVVKALNRRLPRRG